MYRYVVGGSGFDNKCRAQKSRKDINGPRLRNKEQTVLERECDFYGETEKE